MIAIRHADGNIAPSLFVKRDYTRDGTGYVWLREDETGQTLIIPYAELRETIRLLVRAAQDAGV